MGRENHPLFPLVLENLLPKQGLQANWVKEPGRQQVPQGGLWNASVTAAQTSRVSLAAFAGSSLTANSSPGWGAKSLLSKSLNTASVGLIAQPDGPAPTLLKPPAGITSTLKGKQHQAWGHPSVMPASKAEVGDGEFRASLNYIGIPCLNKSSTKQTEQGPTPATSLHVASPS